MSRLSVTQFAKDTGFSRRTIHRWIASGALKPQRTPGGRPYFTGVDVALLLGVFL
jgi:DNA-binding transcriptional MerR regulator